MPTLPNDLAETITQARYAREELFRAVEVLQADPPAEPSSEGAWKPDVEQFAAAVGEYLRAEELLLGCLVDALIQYGLQSTFGL